MEAYVIGRSKEDDTVRILDRSPSATVKVYDYPRAKVMTALYGKMGEKGQLTFVNTYASFNVMLSTMIDLDIQTTGTKYMAMNLLYDIDNKYKLRIISEHGEIEEITIDRAMDLEKQGLLWNFTRINYLEAIKTDGCIKAISDTNELIYIRGFIKTGSTDRLKKQDIALQGKLKMIGAMEVDHKSSEYEMISEIIKSNQPVDRIKYKLNFCKALDKPACLTSEQAFIIVCRLLTRLIQRFKTKLPESDIEKIFMKHMNYTTNVYNEAFTLIRNNARKSYPNRIEVMKINKEPIHGEALEACDRIKIIKIYREGNLVITANISNQEKLDKLIQEVLTAIVYRIGKGLNGDMERIMKLSRYNIKTYEGSTFEKDKHKKINVNDAEIPIYLLSMGLPIEFYTIQLYKTYDTETRDDRLETFFDLSTGNVIEIYRIQYSNKLVSRGKLSGAYDIKRVIDIEDLAEGEIRLYNNLLVDESEKRMYDTLRQIINK